MGNRDNHVRSTAAAPSKGQRKQALLAALIGLASAWVSHAAGPEVRGTWLTTTANDAIATPEKTAATMARLREIGINTVYVECWKNGYTQFPSAVLERTIGVDRRPNLMPQDPSDTPTSLRQPPRDLLQETLIEAHRNGLIYIAWFEYGFMAAHKDTDNHLRRMKPEWLSKDISGGTVAPNGFVWMNPLHPEARRFLTDLVLEAIDKYDLDGVQLDDRIVWPHVSMGYDEFTRKAYAAEHDGQQPPANHTDPEWMRWRAGKVNQFAHEFVAEVRARRPGILLSLSPAPYPWSYEHYCLEWPKWAHPEWSTAGWDEFVPQNYRFSFDAFQATWVDQLQHWTRLASPRPVACLMPGIRIVGDGKDSTWDQLQRSIQIGRESGNGGHVLWFSRGVLDTYPNQLADFYRASDGPCAHPRFGAGWRPRSVAAVHAQKTVGFGGLPDPRTGAVTAARERQWHVWSLPPLPADNSKDLCVIAKFQGRWRVLKTVKNPPGQTVLAEILAGFEGDPDTPEAVEILIDRRADMQKSRPK